MEIRDHWGSSDPGGGLKRAGLTVGLVPTMGYLHEGHMSLVEEAARRCDRVVASVFVNPTQFGPGEDLATYPRDFARDRALLEDHGCHLVFHPLGGGDVPCRGGHLCRGLFGDAKAAVRKNPTHPFPGGVHGGGQALQHRHPGQSLFGWKDAQQLLILRRMVRDLGYGVELVGCPIVREPDGLAKSSRNTYLTPQERQAARVLSQAVFLGQSWWRKGNETGTGWCRP